MFGKDYAYYPVKAEIRVKPNPWVEEEEWPFLPLTLPFVCSDCMKERSLDLTTKSKCVKP